MKNRYYQGLLCGVLMLASPAALRAQFSVPWFVIAGGGGTATNNVISISGTFGQWEAAPPVTNGLFSLTSGFWGFSGSTEFVVPPPPPGTTLFSDTFAGNTINPSNWVTSGNVVVQTNGMIVVSNNAVNDGGVLTSLPFALNNSTGLITLTRDVLVHAAPNTTTNFGAYDFLGQFGITVGAVPPFSVDYADWDYSDGVTYLARYGFYLARDGASPILIADQANVSPPVMSPTNTPWDVWFSETVTYNPTNGVMEYFTNDVLQTNFNVGALTGTGTPAMTLTFNAFGLGTGDYQSMSNLTVSQAAGLTNTAPILVLSGSLAFGNVATSQTNQLTLSNAGNAPLVISNITIAPPLGFALNLTNATLAPGVATNVAVVFTPVVTTNNYSATLTIISDAGTSTVPVSGFVTSGTLELLVDISGNGKVSPSDNGKSFPKSGTKISLKAAPGAGAAFAGWTGSIVSIANPLVFDITNSMVLQANFVSSPFTNFAGTYDGLFGASNAAEATSGLLKGLTVSTKGVYSGTIFISGASHALSGTFVASGQASNYITRTTKLGGPLIVAMTLDLSNTPPQITGTISNTLTAAVANLVAYRATNTGTLKYTMLLEPEPGVLGQTDAPSGYGYLLMSQKAGVLTLSGNLADGTALSQTVPVTAVTGTNQVPVFVSLYANTGLLTGWVSMAGGTTPTGTLDWIKPAAPKSLLYPAGFTNEVTAQGAVWTAPAAHTAALDLSDGQLIISGGSLKTALTFDVSLNSANALTAVAGTNNSTNSVKGTIAPATGLLTVTFGNGAGKATTIGKGAVLLDTTNGAGYFLTKTNAGSIILQQ
jgi:hypothetical protein